MILCYNKLTIIKIINFDNQTPKLLKTVSSLQQKQSTNNKHKLLSIQKHNSFDI